MNPKSKANFINSITAGQTVSDPKPASSAPAFATVASAPAAAKAPKYVEPTSVFADGLPEWDIVPPQVMVRRR